MIIISNNNSSIDITSNIIKECSGGKILVYRCFRIELDTACSYVNKFLVVRITR